LAHLTSNFGLLTGENFMKRLIPSFLAACAALAFVVAPIARAEEPKVNVGAMVTDMMKMQLNGNQQQLVMWMPFEFFVACGTAQGDSWDAASKAMEGFKPYHVVCVMREVTNADGTSTYATAEQVSESVVLKGPNGEEVKPVTNVPPKVASMAAVMRQAMSQQGGAQAENMRLLFFPRQIEGKEFGSAEEKGKFTIELKAIDKFDASTVTYHTPFDALKPQHECPKCKEMVSAKWNFCPFCGAKQESAK
jgi:hypothetical protein